MKTDDSYFMDSILQRFIEKIPLKSFSEQYLRNHYICFSVVESIKADYSITVITEQDYVDLNALNGSTKEVTYYYDPNFSRGVFCTQDINLRYIDLEGILVQDLKKLI